MTYILYAEDLASKFGFGDGDMFDELIFDLEDETGKKIDFDPLIDVVKTYLIPLLPEDVKIEEIGSCHNPIRLVNLADENKIKDISVTVTKKQVIEIIRRNIK